MVAHETGLAAQLDLRRVVVSPASPHAQVEARSPVICDYLAATGAAGALFPQDGPARWAGLRHIAALTRRSAKVAEALVAEALPTAP